MTKHRTDIICPNCKGTHIHDKHQTMTHTNRKSHTVKCTKCHYVIKK